MTPATEPKATHTPGPWLGPTTIQLTAIEPYSETGTGAETMLDASDVDGVCELDEECPLDPTLVDEIWCLLTPKGWIYNSGDSYPMFPNRQAAESYIGTHGKELSPHRLVN